jgi:hypothetical protein
MKNSVKIIDQKGSGILWFELKFLYISETKRKEGIILRPFEESQGAARRMKACLRLKIELGYSSW